MKKIVAIASFGGHWIQLMRLRPVFDKNHTVYISTSKALKLKFNNGKYYCVLDGAKEKKITLALMAVQCLYHFVRIRPEVVVTTGAAAGLVFLIIAKFFGAKTIWIDSIANAEEMSLSGKLAKKYSDIWLSQWEDVAKKSGAGYLGSVL